MESCNFVELILMANSQKPKKFFFLLAVVFSLQEDSLNFFSSYDANAFYFYFCFIVHYRTCNIMFYRSNKSTQPCLVADIRDN